MNVFQALLESIPFLEAHRGHDEGALGQNLRTVPWRASTLAEEPYETYFKSRILQIAKDEEAFLKSKDDCRIADVELASAGSALEEDPNLRQLRFKIVPKCISEDCFWRIYFGKVAKIKQELMGYENTGESDFLHVSTFLSRDSDTDSGSVKGEGPCDILSNEELDVSGHSASLKCSGAAHKGFGSAIRSKGLRCSSQSSSLTEAMVMSPRCEDLAELPQEGQEEPHPRELEFSFPMLRMDASGNVVLQENEESQFAKVEDIEEEIEGPHMSDGAVSCGEWVLL